MGFVCSDLEVGFLLCLVCSSWVMNTWVIFVVVVVGEVVGGFLRAVVVVGVVASDSTCSSVFGSVDVGSVCLSVSGGGAVGGIWFRVGGLTTSSSWLGG